MREQLDQGWICGQGWTDELCDPSAQVTATHIKVRSRVRQNWTEEEESNKSHEINGGVEVFSGFRLTVGVHHLKNVAVGFPEEEPFEGCVPDWFDEFGSVGQKALLERLEFCKRVVEGEVSPELSFEWGRGESLHVKQV